MISFDDRLTKATGNALRRYRRETGKDVPFAPNVELVHSEGFWAEASNPDEIFCVRIGSQAIVQIDDLWATAWQSSVLTNDQDERLSALGHDIAAPADLADLSLEWLVTHELMHGVLQHMPLLGVASLVETGSGNGGAGSVGSVQDALMRNLSASEVKKVRLCLELQADNEASDVLFGSFNDANWNDVRAKAASIFVVMALIERENERIGAVGKTHPKASTRYFTLLAQLAQFWLYGQATLEPGNGESWLRTSTRPDPKLFRHYAEQVLASAIDDALLIALSAGANAFAAEVRDKGKLLRDISAIQYTPDLMSIAFETGAALEWRELLPINEKIMAVTGLRS